MRGGRQTSGVWLSGHKGQEEGVIRNASPAAAPKVTSSVASARASSPSEPWQGGSPSTGRGAERCDEVRPNELSRRPATPILCFLSGQRM